LEKSDLTNAQKRDQRFYPKDGVIVFNQKVRQAAPGASGKLLGIVKIGVLVEVDGKCVTVANKLLDKITVCLPREIPIAVGERLHLKANRTLAAGARTPTGNWSRSKPSAPMAESNWPTAGFWEKVSVSSSRLRGHVLWFTGQDRGSRSLF
jgi:hypothetical protein